MKRLAQVNPIPKQNVSATLFVRLTWIYLLMFAVQVKASPKEKPLLNSDCNTYTCMEAMPPLACKGLVQLSLGADGTGLLTASMLLADPQPSYAQFKVYANHTGSRIITCSDAGRSIMATVLDTITGQSCWSTVMVEDKLMPRITCNSDTIPCTEDPFTYDYSRFVVALDNCDASPTVVYDLRYEKLTCHPRYTAIAHLTWRATDNYNNTSSCTGDIYFKKATLDSVVFPNDTTVYCPNPNLSSLNAPTLFGLPIDPFCELLATHSDDSIFICGGMYKINRLWIVMDWCTRTNVMATQQITVADTTSPIINCPADITLFTSSSTCSVNYIIPTPTATDACSPSALIQYFVRVDSIYLARPGNTIPLSVGTHTMNYIAMDPCGNSDTCLSTITVRDAIAPTMLCLPRVILSLDQLGFACISADQIARLGSISDNCGIDTILIRRMTAGCSRPQDTIFRDTICFCCSDLTRTQMIVVQARDESGNSNFCMMEIVLQNKNGMPPPICPAPITLSCTANFRDLSLTGRIVPSGVGCNDTIRTAFRDSIRIDSCREGTVTRKFFIYYVDGRIDSTCRQTITIVNNYVFNAAHIIWPRDTNISNCRSNHPDSIRSRPSNPRDSCLSVYYTFTNSNVRVRNDSCRYIERYWLAYNTCTPRRTARDTQIIVLDNFIGPILIGPNDTTIASVRDSCSRWVILRSAIVTGCNSMVTVTNSYNNRGANASDIFPPGRTRIIFTARDGCNNITRDTTNIIVLDQINPLIQCKLLDTIMPSADSIKLTARNLLVNYTDNCTPSNRLRISFSIGNFNDTCRVIHCRDLTSPPDTFVFQIFVQDSAGNIGICPATVYVRDPFNNCSTLFNGVGIYGLIKTVNGAIVPDIDINLSSHNRTTNVNNIGEYVFSQLNYKDFVNIKPYKNDQWLEGLSTNDILRIQKHILGIKSFSNPEEWISADLDNNGSVTTSDMVWLRKLILGKVSDLPHNTSYRFISSKQQYDDMNNPLESDLLERYDNDQLNHDLRLDFKAIKIGDVSAQNSNLLEVEAQSRLRIHDFIFENKTVQKSEKVIQDIHIGKNTDIEGFQLGFDFDQNELELESIHEFLSNLEGDEIKSENYSIKNGSFFMSMIFPEVIKSKQSDRILRFVWKSKTNKSLDQILHFENGSRRSELYTGNGIADRLKLSFGNNSVQTDIISNWNVMPNPFKYKCYMQFDAIESGVANLDIFDLSGKRIYSSDKIVEKNQNIWWIESNLLPHHGTYIYKVKMKNQEIEGKIILIK